MVVHGRDFEIGIPVGITTGMVGELSYPYRSIMVLQLFAQARADTVLEE